MMIVMSMTCKFCMSARQDSADGLIILSRLFQLFLMYIYVTMSSFFFFGCCCVQLSYSLNHINRKLITESKTSINSRIVVVGASDVGISFLETLVFW